MRAHFEAQGFVEVEPAALQVSPGNETHLHGFATELIDQAGTRARAYLHTSPEFAMKKLLAAGETRIFALARVFRNRERTRAARARVHDAGMVPRRRGPRGADGAIAPPCCGSPRKPSAPTRLRFRGREADPFAEFERLSVREAFLRHAGVDLFDDPRAVMPGLVPDIHAGVQGEALSEATSPAPLTHALDTTWMAGTSPAMTEAACKRRPRATAPPSPTPARATACASPPTTSWSDLFSRLLSEKVEPQPRPRPPDPAHRLSRQRSGARPPLPRRSQGRRALRALRLRRRARQRLRRIDRRRRSSAAASQPDMALKQEIYGESYPIDEDFLACLPYLPESSGAALGFDRVAMLACGADAIEDVQWTPVFRP